MNELYIYLGKALFLFLIYAVPFSVFAGIGWIVKNKSKVALWIGRNFYGEDWTK